MMLDAPLHAIGMNPELLAWRAVFGILVFLVICLPLCVNRRDP